MSLSLNFEINRKNVYINFLRSGWLRGFKSVPKKITFGVNESTVLCLEICKQKESAARVNLEAKCSIFFIKIHASYLMLGQQTQSWFMAMPAERASGGKGV